MRWRKLLVHFDEAALFSKLPAAMNHEPAMTRHHKIKAGVDLRTSGIGSLKNHLAEPVAVIYAPLCWIEAVMWSELAPD